MQGRKRDIRWTLVIPAIALATVVLVFLSRNDGGAARARVITHPARVSQTLGAREFRAPAAAPAATLAETLLAADALVKAGFITPPPTLAETLQAADALVKAGIITPPPTLEQTLLAADALVKAGVITPPPPPLIDILRAASILAGANAAPPAPDQAQDPPPAATATLQVAAPTNTPPPATATPLPPTKTPVAATKIATVAPGSGGWFDDAFSAQVFSLVNQRRQAAGLQPLAVEPRLANSAADYAKVLADNNWFSHTGPDGSTLVTRAEAAGFPFTVQLGEVLAWGSNGWTPNEIVRAWMDSPAHREQILSPVYTRAGAGCYFTSKATQMVRCAMEFAG